ncbi:PR domain zinc finger protein 8 [Trichonephila inaurata madagascariensis]|uniref:PR domain zinc finger protein 8 n=1 Tax=Trichonephila inaurata madagascariensis TaxID=2747483 RepID=A0A8X7BY87_9ARAC|nr:PR domain zinc finger protein 8 [Trichonephila inaurata madagascariensis]
MSEPYISVVTEDVITCGTLLGPLPLSSGSPDSLAVLTWRCVDKLSTSKQVLKIEISHNTHKLAPKENTFDLLQQVSLKDQFNGNGLPKTPSWLAHILPARNPDEQTLEIIVKGGQLYFRSLRELSSGEELRAWFGQDLADILKLPVIPPNVMEGKKRFECMLCQEQFENPFPVVAHLMYRCRRKDQGVNMHNPFRKTNGGRVKNFDIATLTDMNNDSDNRNEQSRSPQSPTSSVTSDSAKMSDGITDPLSENNGRGKKRLENLDEYVSTHKKPRLSVFTERDKTREEGKVVDSTSSSPRKTPSEAFKLTTPSNVPMYHSPIHTNVDLSPPENNSSSAFKKVDKSSAAFHPNITSLSLFTGGIDPRELLFQSGANGFAPFPYPLTPVTSTPSYHGVTLPQNGVSPVSPPVLTAPTMDGHMTSAFAPSAKLSTTVSSSSGAMHQQLKMEEFKVMRKMPNLADGGYELTALMSPTLTDVRMSSMPSGLQYAPKPQPMDVFAGAKGLPPPLLPFLPPSLAALSFPSQNWCAKCNASFRMTSDLVYHMRSHHKKQTDPQKLKREEKLRCHICNESFRERHHLTRHMTSHQ